MSGDSSGARRNQEAMDHKGREGSRDDEELPILEDWLAPDEVEQAGDLGNDLDDVDGPEQARLGGAADAPTRESFLLHRIAESLGMLGALRARKAERREREERVPHEVWRRLGDEALGITWPSGEGHQCPSEADPRQRPSGDDELPAGIADSMAVNLAGFLRVMSWLESGARKDRHAAIVRSLSAALSRDIPSRMPR